MNIMRTLETFKGKELDNALLQFITKIFDAQNSQINQLKEGNSALQGNLSDYSDQLARVQNEKTLLNKVIQQLEMQISSMQAEAAKSRLTEVETAILSNCINADISGFCSEDMVISLPFSRLEITNTIDQMERKGLLQVGPLAPSGTFYTISDRGKKYEHDIESDDYSF